MKLGFQTQIVILTACILASSSGWASSSSGGDHALGIGAAIFSPGQTDLNSYTDSTSLVGTKDLSTGYEFMLDYEYRIPSSIFAIIFRPSYFTQSASGGGVSTSVSGYSIFPMLKIYALENSFIHFYMQVGFGYGNVNAAISNGSASGTWTAGQFGAQAGLGALFCITPSHCIVVEGNGRYLDFNRVLGSGSGSFGGNATQTSANELEIKGRDADVSMSGVQGVLGYKFIF
jgi:hypothetical protein